MEEEVLSSLARKLGIDGHEVIQNASELSRLAALRGSSLFRSLSMSGSTKSVICLELAANSCNIPVDRASTYRLSGMPTKKAYQHAYKTFECMLGKQKSYTVNDLAVQFGVFEATKFAELLLKSYFKKAIKISLLNKFKKISVTQYFLQLLFTLLAA
ncbi:hypothetical protein QZH41_006262 [Actinostola sp. cb2023]|nr:hypothetical protein QZH41_006262 [Actinostola sp. cb2023]